MSESTIQTDTTEAEKIAGVVDAIVTTVDPPIGAAIGAGLTAAEGVAGAVEAPHQTAIAAIGAGVQALAASPIVATDPKAAARASVATSFFAWLKSEFSWL